MHSRLGAQISSKSQTIFDCRYISGVKSSPTELPYYDFSVHSLTKLSFVSVITCPRRSYFIVLFLVFVPCLPTKVNFTILRVF